MFKIIPILYSSLVHQSKLSIHYSDSIWIYKNDLVYERILHMMLNIFPRHWILVIIDKGYFVYY